MFLKKMVKKNLLKKEGEWKWVFSGYFLDKNQRGLPLECYLFTLTDLAGPDFLFYFLNSLFSKVSSVFPLFLHFFLQVS